MEIRKKIIKKLNILLIFALVSLGIFGCGNRDKRGQLDMGHFGTGKGQENTSVAEPNEEDGSSGQGIYDSDTVISVDEIEEAMREEEEYYIILSVNTEDRLISFGSPFSTKSLQFGYTDGTRILDKYGDYTTVDSLKCGRVVTLGKRDNQAKLTEVKIAEEVLYQTGITRYEINEKRRLITVGSTKYTYDDNLRVFLGSSEISLSQIGKEDELTIQAFGTDLVSIRVTKGHGTIALTNTELFEGGWISLGTKIYSQITKDMTLSVPAGKYDLSVANKGWGDTGKVTVKPNEVTLVDLALYKGEGPSYCSMKFEVGVDNARIYVDGEEIIYEEPVQIEYGIHLLKVVADGFDPWERQLVVHSKEATIEIGDAFLSDNSDNSSETAGENQEDGDSEENSNTTGGENQNTGTVDNRNGDNSMDAYYADYLSTLSTLLDSITEN